MVSSLLAWGVPLLTVAAATKVELFNKETAQSSAGWITYNWAVNVSLGGQVLPLLIDTGSSDLWVFSTELPKDEAAKHPQLYDPSKSKTLKKRDDLQFNITYASTGDWAAGRVVEEKVQIGDAIVPNLVIGIADSIGVLEYDFQGYAGVIGFSFLNLSSVTPTPQPTFMQMIQSQLDKPIFSTDFKEDGTGSIQLGSVDTAEYTGTLTSSITVDNSSNSWVVDGVSYSIGNTALTNKAYPALFDTGGIYTSIDLASVKEYYKQVGGAKSLDREGQLWTYPCANTLPDLTFTFSQSGISPAVIPGKLFNVGADSSLNADGVTTCKGGLTAVAQGEPTIGVGVPFFLSQYVIFNQAAPSIMFAPQSNAQTSTPGSPTPTENNATGVPPVPSTTNTGSPSATAKSIAVLGFAVSNAQLSLCAALALAFGYML